jgi:methylmalonyl-CoA mutase N-terminal domain/subunit
VADSVDPLAGAYLIEYLTDEIERRAQEYIDKIDSMGGALAAIEQGYIQREIQEAAYRYQQSIERGEQVVVGLNAFKVDEKITLERLEVDPVIEQAQRERLQELRKNRNAARVSELLARLENAARGTDNLIPLLIECVENDITLGEICNLLRKLWGEYEPSTWV